MLSAKYNNSMSAKHYARLLGSRGGKARAKKLSQEKRKTIAASGGQARAESYHLAKRIEENFYYVSTIEELQPPPRPQSTKIHRYKLPGIYEKS